MHPTVDSYCDLLVRSRLLSADEVRAIHQRWLRSGGAPAAHVGRFAQWLVANGFLTSYQASRLARGRTEGYFVDRYKILDKVIQGPQGRLYQAVHETGQLVLIKVLAPHKSGSPELIRHLFHEAKRVVGLQHANVIRLFQVIRSSGRLFLILEHLEGETLDEIVARRGWLPPAEAVPIVYQALRGLGYLHEHGIDHVAPRLDSLMLIPPSGAGAREVAAPAAVKIIDVLPHSESPSPPDIRAGIRSLGRVLYECLAGPSALAAC